MTSATLAKQEVCFEAVRWDSNPYYPLAQGGKPSIHEGASLTDRRLTRIIA